LQRRWSVCDKAIHKRPIGAAAIGGEMQERRGDRIAVVGDAAPARLDEAPQCENVFAAGHQPRVHQQGECAVGRRGRRRRRRACGSAPDSDASAGERDQIACELRAQNPPHRAQVAERLVERGGADREIAGGAGGGEHAQPIDRLVLECKHLHGRHRITGHCPPRRAVLAKALVPS